MWPFVNFQNLTSFLPMVDLGLLLLIGLILFVIRSNSQHALEVEDINNRLKSSLLQKRKKEEDLLVLNKTLHEMSQDLDYANIIEAYGRGVLQIFGPSAQVGVYLSDSQNPNVFTLMNSRSNIFIPIMHLAEGKQQIECDHCFKVPTSSYECLSHQIEAHGRRGIAVLATPQVLFSGERILFLNLTKHLNSSLQNASLLLKVEDANKSKTAFLANMSHEIRTPLNALMGFSQMIAREDLSTESKQQLSQNIIKNGDQLMRIVDDILDLSKAEAGKLVVVKKNISLMQLLDEVGTVMNLRAMSKKISFTVDADARVPETILTDSVRLKQILMNVIGNAIKFTDRGHVRVGVSHELGSTENQLIFKIEDTGIGIPLHLRDTLFLPFSQGDNSSTRKFGGTGLGLAISRRLATELGGDLTLIASEAGKGSAFQLRIGIGDCENTKWFDRVVSVNKEEETEKINIKDRLKEKKIMLVEDSPDNQDFFTFYLREAGANVLLADNGLDAVGLALTNDFDVILMDIQIPGIDGKEATRRIRAKEYGGPIIALTAHALLTEKEECLLAGCTSQISKPVLGENLILGIEKVLQQKKGEHEFANRNVQEIC